MSDLPRISFVIPAYNEAGGILETLQRITKTLSALPNQTEVIVVNDGSRDETAALVSAFGQGVKLISHPINIGYGNALKTGIRAAQYEYVGITDADGTYEVEDIPT